MKILLIDNHALFREGLRHILQQLPGGVDEILEAEHFADGMRLAAQYPSLGLALLELKSPGSEGAASVSFFRQHHPHIPLVVLSSEEDSHVIIKALNYGANGYVCKSVPGKVLLGALGAVLSGSIYVPPQILQKPGIPPRNKEGGRGDRPLPVDEYALTARQREILGYLAVGLSNKEIAMTTDLAEGTVKTHLAAVYLALRVKKRMEAVQVAKRLGFVDGAEPETTMNSG